MNSSTPETIGSFRILAKIGQGGMGTVYRAVHGTLERPVALKILPTEFANNPEYVMRFLREARTVAALRHENIVHVYDAGEQGGAYFIAMELIDGCNLGTYADEHRNVSEKDGLGLLLQAAKGLSAAHTKGLVHRDIKPENLLLGTDNILRIVDFGLVMESTSTTQLTATGACLGTPMYMSPEQADGESADARTDIYSLGVTFYRVFTGQTPFTSPTVMNLLFKHKFEAPPEPKSIRPDLSANVNSLLLHMLAKRREDRPQTAQALIEMIETIKQGKSIPPPPKFVPHAAMGTGSATEVTMLGPNSIRRDAHSSHDRPRRVPILGILVICLMLAVMVTLFYVVSHSTSATAPADGSTDTSVAKSSSVSTSIETAAVPIKNDPPPDDALKRGDTAFAAGKFRDALEEYKIGQNLQPRSDELAGRIRKAERAIALTDLMEKGSALEANGQWEDALTQFTAAKLYDEGTVAQQHIDAVTQKLAEQKQLDALNKNASRDAELKKAEAAEKSFRFDIATEHYSRAAMLSEPEMRVTLAEKAKECRRQDYLARAKACESLSNFADAEFFYKKALDLGDDPLIVEKLAQLRTKLQPAQVLAPPGLVQPISAPGDRDFNNALNDARVAMIAADFKGARAKLELAKKLQPSRSEPAALGLEIDGRELISQGDALQAKGDSSQAAVLFRKAAAVCPDLRALADARIAAPGAFSEPPKVEKSSPLTDRIDAYVRAYKDDDATADLANEQRLTPKNERVQQLSDALENMRNGGWIYHELADVCEKGRKQIADALDLEDDKPTKEERVRIKKLIEELNEKISRTRTQFLNHDYDGVKAALATARTDATDTAAKLSAAADFFYKRVELYNSKSSMTVPIVGIQLSGNRKKADRYQRIVDEFRKYAEQAKNLKKFGEK